MAVNSKADKTGGHTSTGLKKPSYTKQPTPADVPALAGLVPSGAKALMFRARKELSAVSTPNEPVT